MFVVIRGSSIFCRFSSASDFRRFLFDLRRHSIFVDCSLIFVDVLLSSIFLLVRSSSVFCWASSSIDSHRFFSNLCSFVDIQFFAFRWFPSTFDFRRVFVNFRRRSTLDDFSRVSSTLDFCGRRKALEERRRAPPAHSGALWAPTPASGGKQALNPPGRFF